FPASAGGHRGWQCECYGIGTELVLYYYRGLVMESSHDTSSRISSLRGSFFECPRNSARHGTGGTDGTDAAGRTGATRRACCSGTGHPVAERHSGSTYPYRKSARTGKPRHTSPLAGHPEECSAR